jgi:hypothetical protein
MRDCPNSHMLTVFPATVTAKRSAESGEPGHLAANTHLSPGLVGSEYPVARSTKTNTIFSSMEILSAGCILSP